MAQHISNRSNASARRAAVLRRAPNPALRPVQVLALPALAALATVALLAAGLAVNPARAEDQDPEVDVFVEQVQVAQPAQAAQMIRGFGRVLAAVQGEQPDGGGMAGSIVLQENRELRRKLDVVRSQLSSGKHHDAIRNLGALLEEAPGNDFFLSAAANQRSRRNFRAELRDVVSQLSPEARRFYEDQYGPAARKQLVAAVLDRDLAALSEIPLRYPHTAAAGEALYLLAVDHFDRGRPREAAVCWQLVADSEVGRRFDPSLSVLLAAALDAAGDSARAQQVLIAWKQRATTTAGAAAGAGARPSDIERPAAQRPAIGDAAAEIAARLEPSFESDDQALGWLRQRFGEPAAVATSSQRDWLAMRGDAGRNRAVPAGEPWMHARWRAPLADETALRRIQEERQALASAGASPLPMLHALAVDDTVLLSTGAGVRAIDFRSGRVLWNYPSDAGDETLADSFWREGAFGSLSTDGARVFVVRGHAGVPADANRGGSRGRAVFWGPAMMWGGGFGSDEDLSPGSSNNRLEAIDIARQGSLLWRVGDAEGAEPRLAGHFFLGAPLHYAGRLYVLAEQKGALKLAVLDARTGRLQWSQELGVTEHPIMVDPFRRMAGATPAISGGVIVCPTAAGGVVAIDLATQSLSWAYQYPRRPESRLDSEQGSIPRLQQHLRWVDGHPLIAGDRVLITPPESGELHCLALRDGRLLWSLPRADNLYLACAGQQHALLVAGRSVTFVNLETGRKTKSILLPENARPTGVGVFTGEKYLLPLSTAAIAEFDLQNPALGRIARSTRGIVPGNLIWQRQAFISVGPEYCEVFDEAGAVQEQVRQHLAADSDDPAAVLRLAEVKLGEGALAEAIEHFRRAHQLKPTGHTRNRLIAALLDGIQQKLPGHEALEDELDALAGF